MAVCTLIASFATPSFAQQPVANVPAQQVQAAQPTQINYNPNGSNINGDKQIMVQSGQIPNPAQAQGQVTAVPSQLPAGLPQDSTTVMTQNRTQGGGYDPIDAALNVLNTPDSKIRQINKDFYRKGKVISETPTNPPKTVNGVVVAHLSPGAVSPVVRLAKNRTTAIVVTDMSGQPWPIINYDGLSEEDFIVKRLDGPSPDGYVLSVTPRGVFVSGNLALVLKGLPSPITIDFVSAQKEVDARTEIRVQAKGPNTQFNSVGLPDSLDTNLLSVLQGVAPSNAKPLKVNTAAVQAWLAKDGSMYVRTRYKVMSPAFENVTSSPDGTFAYKMVAVPVVLYKAADGRFGEFTVEGF